MKKLKKGFTLIELLAVIVILAVILVIAVPKVLNIIDDIKKATLESSAKMVASEAEKRKVQNQVLGKDENITCENVANLNDIDYEKCYIEFLDNKAYVTIFGSNKFENMVICKGTKNVSKVVDRCQNERVSVAFDAAGGSVEDLSGIYKEGEIIDVLNPEKENENFLRWEVISGNSVLSENKLTVGSKDTILQAFYEEWGELIIDLDGGIVSNNQEGKYKSNTMIELESPTKTGYTFNGWSIKSGNGIISGNKLTMGTNNTVIEANYNPNTNTVYTIKHWTQNIGASTTQNSSNYTLNSTENKTGTTATSVTPAAKTITGFTAPSIQTKTILGDGSLVVNYYYTRNSYTYTLVSKTGVSTNGSSDTGIYQYGATITLKATANTGYIWSKWTSSNTSLVEEITTANTTFTMPAGNITMTPNVTKNTYTISYNLNGGTIGSDSPLSGTYGSTVIVSNPTRENYTFTGWSVSGTGATISGTNLTIGDSDVTLTASWTINNTIPEFTYTGSYQIVDDNDNVITTSTGNWKIRFLTSGTLKFTELRGAANGIDVFLVGGGGGGGGGGYTKTKTAISVNENIEYKIQIGSGGSARYYYDGTTRGGTTTAFDQSALGGYSGYMGKGGDGGSGGGGAAYMIDARRGGSDGGSGANGGNGQGSTTREFGESTGKLYASGGTGGCSLGSSYAGSPGENNTGNGGGGGGGGGDADTYSGSGSTGGSGIVIIRDTR